MTRTDYHNSWILVSTKCIFPWKSGTKSPAAHWDTRKNDTVETSKIHCRCKNVPDIYIGRDTKKKKDSWDEDGQNARKRRGWRMSKSNKHMGSGSGIQRKQFGKDTQGRETDWMDGMSPQRLAMKWNESKDSHIRSMRPPVTRGKHPVSPTCY